MKIQSNIRRYVLIALISTVVLSCTDHWPQFRGPDNDMHAKVKDLPQEWGDQESIKWEYPLKGNGWSSPIVWGDRIFLTSANLEKVSDTPDTTSNLRRSRINPKEVTSRWMLSCFDLESGDLLWEQVAHEGNPSLPLHQDNTYASETPVTDGKRVYAYFGMTGLYCYDFEGQLLWERDLGVFSTQSDWGTSSSPVLYKNSLILQLDNEEESFLVALNKKTGEEIWRIPREETTNWSTPVIWKNKVRTELVTLGKKARSYDPRTGDLIWELDLGGGRSIPSPVYNQELLFAGNEKRRDGGGFLFAIKAGVEGDITPAEGDSTSNGVLWVRSNSGLSMPSPLLYKGQLYILDRRENIFCYEETTGREVFPSTRVPDAAPFWATPWIYDDKIWCLDESGTTHVLKPGTDFEVLAKHSIEDKFWSSAAITDQGYIFRGTNKLYCVK